MADVLNYASKVATAWLGVIVGISLNVEDIRGLSKRGKSTFQRYGVPFILVLRGALEAYYQVEHVLESDDENLKYYQESLIMECNMIAVASAIISSLTITTYGFNSILNMHWIVPAVFTLSLILSLFCVYGAVALQRRISNLPSGRPFRAWLTEPSTRHSISQPVPNDSFTFKPRDHHVDDPLRANVATVLTLTAPKTLLDHSIRFFLVGLVGYLICTHYISTRIRDPYNPQTIILSPSMDSAHGSRNIIIVCAFSLCIGISLLISPSSYKNFRLTVSNNSGAHAHGNAGLAEGPMWTGLEHHNKDLSGKGVPQTVSSEKVPNSRQDLIQRLPGAGMGPELIAALREASSAHEKSALAATEVARAEERVAKIYARLINQT